MHEIMTTPDDMFALLRYCARKVLLKKLLLRQQGATCHLCGLFKTHDGKHCRGNVRKRSWLPRHLQSTFVAGDNERDRVCGLGIYRWTGINVHLLVVWAV